MIGLFRKVRAIIWGDQAFIEPTLPYRGADSVLRLVPASHGVFLSDIAGGGAISGYGAAQGAPIRQPHMGGVVALNGSGVASGYGREPGRLLDLARAPNDERVVST